MLTLLVPCSQMWNEFCMMAAELLKLNFFLFQWLCLTLILPNNRQWNWPLLGLKQWSIYCDLFPKCTNSKHKYKSFNILCLNICIYKNCNYDISIFNSNLIFHLQKYSMGFFWVCVGGGGLYIFGMLVMLLGVACCFHEIPFKWGPKKCHSYFLCSSGRRGETDSSMAWFHHQE